MRTRRTSGLSTGPALMRFMKACPTSGYSLTSCSTPSSVSARSRRSARPRSSGSRLPKLATTGQQPSSRRQFLGDLAVVDRGRREVIAGGRQHREAAPHAEPDDPDLARAVLAAGQPLARGLDVRVGLALPAAAGLKRGHHAADPPPGVEVRGEGEVAGGGQAVGLQADVVAQPQRIHDHHHARPGTLAARRGQVRAQLPVCGGGVGRVGHELGPALGRGPRGVGHLEPLVAG